MNSNNPPTTAENGIVIPHDQLNSETLNNLIEEFVTREWSSLSDDGHTLENKVEQIREQLKTGIVRVVFDLTTESANLIADG